MTVQEVKQKLGSVYTEYRGYILAEEKCEQFRDLISCPAPVNLSADTHSEHNGNAMENKIVAAMWYSEEVDRRFRRYILLSREAEAMINEIKYFDQREVLTRRYIMFEDWNTIRIKMNLSKTRMFRLHERALDMLVKICDQTELNGTKRDLTNLSTE